MSKQKFRPELMHGDFTLCKHPACLRSGDCLRRLAYDNAPPFEQAWMIDERRDPTDCPWYRSSEVVRFARGFKGIMSEFKAKDKRAFHWDLQKLFNCCPRYAYKYINGKVPISPDKQEALRDICRSYGVELRFEAFEDGYLL